MFCPVICLAASLAMNATVLATSSGFMNSPKGTLGRKLLPNSSGSKLALSMILVPVTYPRASEFERTFLGPNS